MGHDESDDADDFVEHTGPSRLTPRPGMLDPDDRARLRRLEKSAEDWRIIRAMLLGHEGQPGRLGVLEGQVKAVADGHGARIGALETWRTSLTAKIAAGIAIGTPIAGVITALLTKWIGR